MDMRRAGFLGAMAMLAVSSMDTGPGEEGPPRRDRHGKRLPVEKTQFTTPRKKSDSLSKLLRK